MSKSFAAALAVFVLAQLAYLTWLAGYRAGYDHGTRQAWDTARAALLPREELADSDRADFSPAALPPADAR